MPVPGAGTSNPDGYSLTPGLFAAVVETAYGAIMQLLLRHATAMDLQQHWWTAA